MNKKFDIVVLGAGPGGYSLANILSSHGKKVALVEKKHFGGTCVNEGCISTKTFNKSARALDLLKKSQEYGYDKVNYVTNFENIQKNRINNKELISSVIKKSVIDAKVEILFGEGEVINKNSLKVNDQVIEFEKLIIATGASPKKLNVKGYQEAVDAGFIINSTGALELKNIPSKLGIIGSGPVALEFAYFYATLGAEVSILEKYKFMDRYDADIQNAVKNYLLKNKNITIYEEVELKEFNNSKVIVEINNETKELNFDRILSAIGRVPNTDSVKNLNLELEQNGGIAVNDFMQSSLENVYAIGDATGKMLLSTVAYKTGDIVAKHILNKEVNEKLDTNLVPWSVYLNPEFAGVGQTEQELIKNNISYNKLVIPTAALPKAHADNLDKENGFIKFLINKENDQILGSFMFVEGAHLIINQIAMAMSFNITFTDLQTLPFTHPTIAEAVYYAARGYVFSK